MLPGPGRYRTRTHLLCWYGGGACLRAWRDALGNANNDDVAGRSQEHLRAQQSQGRHAGYVTPRASNFGIWLESFLQFSFARGSFLNFSSTSRTYFSAWDFASDSL